MSLELKFHKDRPHHYIIAVGVHPATSNDAGKMYLKYKPIYFTNDDIEKMQHATMLSKDKLFKTSGSEAIAAVGCSELANTITGIKLAAAMNQCSLHHFSCEEKMDEDGFEILLATYSSSNSANKLLKDSKIRG